MRTRNESDNDKQSSGRKTLEKRAHSHNKSRQKKQYDIIQPSVSSGVPENGLERDDEDVIRINRKGNTPQNAGMGSAQGFLLESGDDDMQNSDWEDGSISPRDQGGDRFHDHIKEVTIEFDEAPDSAGRKPVRRASAEEKELAELVHKVHLLCLLARGRIIDNACDDPLIQASLLSLLPAKFLKISEVSKLTVHDLSPLMTWFHDNFHVTLTSSVRRNKSFHSALCFAVETRGGTSEEIAALFVALLRGLKLTTRFVSILDVGSLKPSIGRYENSSRDACRVRRGIFDTSTVMVDKTRQVPPIHPARSVYVENDSTCESSLRTSCKSQDDSRGKNTQSKDPSVVIELNNRVLDSSTPKAQCDDSKAFLKEKSQGSKRKGDIEFEMQLEMALSATTAGITGNSMSSDVKKINFRLSSEPSALKILRKDKNKESSSSSTGISVAVGAGKVGSPLHWAEVFCTGETSTGKWVHVDAVNAIIDGEQRVEAAAAACRTSLRYVVAFAGRGAKDVTRRYCTKWYKIASQRINSTWWDAVLAPLREIESRETGGIIHVEKHHVDTPDVHRNYLEDMELETRALTEPLPTNMQAYRNHHLYAIEKWLTKHQILHPKGPILGFCSSHPVYPRDCVQTLRTKHRWLCEGLQVKSMEVPAKVLKHSAKLKKTQFSEDDDYGEDDSKGIVELYGKWQLEPLCLPRAVNGIVPKNERGNVEVWSEKCLPPGTVHVRLPRVFSVAKRLGIDYAPAMVGFEFRNGSSIPVFDGIVVCAEFEDAILEAFAEEEERREAEEKKRNEAQALSRWYQLLSSVVTRQRLNNRYGESSSAQMPSNIQNVNMESNSPVAGQDGTQSFGCQSEGRHKRKSQDPSVAVIEDHEHVFCTEDQSSDESNTVRIKRCNCGFSVQVEEL